MNIKEKQDKELNDKQLLILKHLVLGNASELDKGGKQAQVVIDEMQRFIKKYIIQKVRKETALAVCDEMIEQLDYNGLRENLGYSERKKVEGEIKKEILNNLTS